MSDVLREENAAFVGKGRVVPKWRFCVLTPQRCSRVTATSPVLVFCLFKMTPKGQAAEHGTLVINHLVGRDRLLVRGEKMRGEVSTAAAFLFVYFSRLLTRFVYT